jgi:hypothetical protein
MRHIALISTFAAGLACGVLGFMLIAQQPTGLATVEPGTEVVSILEEEVMSVVFRTDKMTFTAQRSKPGASFAMQITYADGRPAQQCQVSSNLAGQLGAYSTIKAKHQFASQQQAERDFPVQLGTLELRDRMKDEPSTVIRLRTSSDRNALAALYENVAVEVTTPGNAFASLEDGCRLLSGP